MQLLNKMTSYQLRDAAYNVSSRQDILGISGMFNIEIKFAADALLKWFNAKIKFKNLELDTSEKIKFQKENPVNWQKDKFCVCNLAIDVNPKSLEYEEPDMSCFDFIIRK